MSVRATGWTTSQQGQTAEVEFGETVVPRPLGGSRHILAVSRWERVAFGKRTEAVVVMKKGSRGLSRYPLLATCPGAEIGGQWTGIHRFSFSAVMPPIVGCVVP